MGIKNLFDQKKLVVSCEIFPPKPDYPIETIFATLESLSAMKPDFISVTYGAGGSSCARTVQIASKVKNDFGVETLAHLTCVGADKQATDAVLRQLQENNIGNVLALRGDLPPEIPCGSGDDYHEYAKDLIAHIKAKYDFCIAAAAYPEGHPRCASLELDRQHLKQKVAAGADFLITQLFFDNQLFYEFLAQVRNAGIQIPISAGIMPIVNKKQIEKTVALSGASLPHEFTKMISLYENRPEELYQHGIQYAVDQIRDLLEHGVDGIHLYTMNNPDVALAVYEKIKDLL